MGLIEGQPMCGHCYTAWDLVYRRVRSNTSIGRWLSYCRQGGCDPDIWDFVNDAGGLVEGEPPPFVERLFHRRNHNNPHGWQFGNKGRIPLKDRVSYTPQQLAEKNLQRRIAEREIADAIEWDEAVPNTEEEIEWE